MTKEALKLALEALETLMIERGSIYDKAITAIKEALAQPEQEPTTKAGELRAMKTELWKQPEQEPVAIVDANDEGYWAEILPDRNVKVGQLLYTTPPQRKPLTDEEIQKCYETTGHYQTLRPQDRFAVFALARAIEAAHGIKGEA